MAFLKVSGMVQWVKVIEVFSVAENSTIAEAANYISEELVKHKSTDFYRHIHGDFTLIPETNDPDEPREPERTDEVLELFNSHYFRKILNETDEEMERRKWEASKYYSLPNHAINFANSIAQDAPNGSQAIIDFISRQLNLLPTPVNVEDKSRASFLSINDGAKLLDLIEEFKTGNDTEQLEVVGLIARLLNENKYFQSLTKSQVANIQIEQSPILDNTYSTGLINVLNLTVTEFFNPRKNVDARKDEVTEWIKAKGKELNIIVSDNVADTIFTIIKPNDHNPKIRRA